MSGAGDPSNWPETCTGKTGRPRLLLSAYACNPYLGSEPGVGWQRALSAAQHYDTWVLHAETPHGPAIRQYLREHGEVPGLTFVAIQKNRLGRWLRSVPGLYYLSYRVWQRQALDVARQLHRDIRFDMVHHVTFCTYREPGYLWQLGVPFIWGPLGGTHQFPWRMLPAAGPRGCLRELCRNLVNAIQLRSPRIARAAKRSSIVLSATSTTQQHLRRRFGRDCPAMLETGAPSCSVPTQERTPGRPLTLLWVGDVEPWKAPRLLIHALTYLPRDFPLEVRVVGDGSELRRCRRLATRRGVGHLITWLGRLDRMTTLQQYCEADLFLFTSQRDTSGNVLLEALATGLPIICFDHHGARDIVTDDCGILLHVSTPQRAAQSIAQAILQLSHQDQRQARADAATARAAYFSWPEQSRRMAQVYDDVYRSSARGDTP